MPDNTDNPVNYPLVFEPQWDWHDIERVLLIRLRSIGDAVLTTPSIIALRRHLPQARIDILLEDWVAPVLDGFHAVDNVISYRSGKVLERMRLSRSLRKTKYDLVYNMHGGSTSAFFTAATGAKHRVGFGHYRYGKTYNHLVIPASDFWGTVKLQSAEQQLAMLGWTGVPVSHRPKTSLTVNADAREKIATRLRGVGLSVDFPFALFHPAAAFESKQWPAERFAAVAEYLSGRNIATVAVATKAEEHVLQTIRESSSAIVHTFNDLSLSEITALAAHAALFVGNDSGIAHIASAVGTPPVVIFGSSNVDHWRPFTDIANEVVSSPGGIEGISVEQIITAVERLLAD